MLKFLIPIFIVFSSFYVFFFSLIPDSFQMLFKLIPMALIIFIAITTKSTNSKKYQRIIIIALIFCAIGDYTIQWFLIGLISFLIGHLFYIYAFSSILRLKKLTKLQYALIIYAVLMIAFLGGTLFYKGEIVLAIMVILYIVVIVTMGLTAVRTQLKFAIFGALLFILSDSILAINKFIISVPFSHVLIMLTYYSAQILLALSIGTKLKDLSSDTIETNEK